MLYFYHVYIFFILMITHIQHHCFEVELKRNKKMDVRQNLYISAVTFEENL